MQKLGASSHGNYVVQQQPDSSLQSFELISWKIITGVEKTVALLPAALVHGLEVQNSSSILPVKRLCSESVLSTKFTLARDNSALKNTDRKSVV